MGLTRGWAPHITLKATTRQKYWTASLNSCFARSLIRNRRHGGNSFLGLNGLIILPGTRRSGPLPSKSPLGENLLFFQSISPELPNLTGWMISSAIGLRPSPTFARISTKLRKQWSSLQIPNAGMWRLTWVIGSWLSCDLPDNPQSRGLRKLTQNWLINFMAHLKLWNELG